MTTQKQINLLPWREKRRKKQVRNFLMNLMIAILISASLFGFLHYLKKTTWQQNQLILETLQAQQVNLYHLQKSLKQDFQSDEIKESAFTSKQLTIFLNLLQHFPFKQGKISRIDLKKNQIKLQGISPNPYSFHQLKKFLMTYPSLQGFKTENISQKEEGIFFTFLFSLN